MCELCSYKSRFIIYNKLLGRLNHFDVAKTLALGSAAVYKHTLKFGLREGLLLIKAPKQQIYKSRFNTEMKQGMSTQQQDQHWIAGATEAQQLNPGAPDQRQASSPNQRKWKFLGRSHD